MPCVLDLDTKLEYPLDVLAFSVHSTCAMLNDGSYIGTQGEAVDASRSVRRALDMLVLLSTSDRPLGLAEIASTLVVPKSSALRLLRALVCGEFAQVGQDGRYRLGIRSFEIGAAYQRTTTPLVAVGDELEELTRRFGVTSHFAVLDRTEVVYMAKYDPSGPGPKLASSLGARLPARTTAVGKAQLAHSASRETPHREQRVTDPAASAMSEPTHDRGSLLPSDQTTQTSAEFMELAKVRVQGYSVDEGTTAPGVRCLAAPVFDRTGCCGAIGVSTLQAGGPDHLTLVTAVVAAAQRASERLGGEQAHP